MAALEENVEEGTANPTEALVPVAEIEIEVSLINPGKILSMKQKNIPRDRDIRTAAHIVMSLLVGDAEIMFMHCQVRLAGFFAAAVDVACKMSERGQIIFFAPTTGRTG